MTGKRAGIGSCRNSEAFCTFEQFLVYCTLGTLSSKL